MHGRDPNMDCISSRSLREQARIHNGLGDIIDRLAKIEKL